MEMLRLHAAPSLSPPADASLRSMQPFAAHSSSLSPRPSIISSSSCSCSCSGSNINTEAMSTSSSSSSLSLSERPLTPSTPFSAPSLPETPQLPQYHPSLRIHHPKPQSYYHRQPPFVPATFASPAGASAAGARFAGSDLSNQDEYLQFLEPAPVKAPTYESLPPGGCPRYPITPNTDGPDELPSYTPAIYKIGVVSRKIEWITPYEPSTARVWKNMIIELNSTQLNFYHIPSNIESQILSFQPSAIGSTTGLQDFNSQYTKPEDLEFHKFVQKLGITQKNITRSYTLQHSTVGLAADYRKKANVMRLRIESEQILLEFPDTQSVIDWNFVIGIGKDVALDLQEREVPRYRTVPRRRRHSDGNAETRGRRNTTFGNERTSTSSTSSTSSNPFRRRKRAQSDVVLSYANPKPSSFRFSRIKSKLLLSSSLASNETLSSVTNQRSATILPESSARPVFVVPGEDEDDEDEDEELAQALQQAQAAVDADLHDNDEGEGDEEMEGMEDFFEDYTGVSIPYQYQKKLTFASDDSKWDPLASFRQSPSKQLRISLRCIKALNGDDSWVGKTMVRPTTLSPVNLLYLRNMKYNGTESNSSSCSSLLSLNANLAGSKKKSFSYKDIPMYDTSLPKLPNHFLKEFTVGSHGLIPGTL